MSDDFEDEDFVSEAQRHSEIMSDGNKFFARLAVIAAIVTAIITSAFVVIGYLILKG